MGLRRLGELVLRIIPVISIDYNRAVGAHADGADVDARCFNGHDGAFNGVLREWYCSAGHGYHFLRATKSFTISRRRATSGFLKLQWAGALT
jgi:hypothetical protein